VMRFIVYVRGRLGSGRWKLLRNRFGIPRASRPATTLTLIVLLMGTGFIAPAVAGAGGKGGDNPKNPVAVAAHGDRDDDDSPLCNDKDDNGKHKGDKNHGGPGEDSGKHKGDRNEDKGNGKGHKDDEECTTPTPGPLTGGLVLDKKVNGGDHNEAGDALVVEPGTTVNYTVEITNNGLEPMTISALTDSVRENLAADCDNGVGFILMPGESISCAYSDVASGSQVHNVASATGVPIDGGDPVSVMDETFVGAVLPLTPTARRATPIVAQPHQTG